MEGGGVSAGEEEASEKDGVRHACEVSETARVLQRDILGGVVH